MYPGHHQKKTGKKLFSPNTSLKMESVFAANAASQVLSWITNFNSLRPLQLVASIHNNKPCKNDYKQMWLLAKNMIVKKSLYLLTANTWVFGRLPLIALSRVRGMSYVRKPSSSHCILSLVDFSRSKARACLLLNQAWFHLTLNVFFCRVLINRGIQDRNLHKTSSLHCSLPPLYNIGTGNI